MAMCLTSSFSVFQPTASLFCPADIDALPNVICDRVNDIWSDIQKRFNALPGYCKDDQCVLEIPNLRNAKAEKTSFLLNKETIDNGCNLKLSSNGTDAFASHVVEDGKKIFRWNTTTPDETVKLETDLKERLYLQVHYKAGGFTLRLEPAKNNLYNWHLQSKGLNICGKCDFKNNRMMCSERSSGLIDNFFPKFNLQGVKHVSENGVTTINILLTQKTQPSGVSVLDFAFTSLVHFLHGADTLASVKITFDEPQKRLEIDGLILPNLQDEQKLNINSQFPEGNLFTHSTDSTLEINSKKVSGFYTLSAKENKFSYERGASVDNSLKLREFVSCLPNSEQNSVECQTHLGDFVYGKGE